VTVLRALDAILREETQEEHSLDDVVRVLAERRSRVTATELRELAESIGGVDLQAFFRRHVGAPR
jgi:predicted metalloprotease with PDZ domain